MNKVYNWIFEKRNIFLVIIFFIMTSISAINFVLGSVLRMRVLAPIYTLLFVFLMSCFNEKKETKILWDYKIIICWLLFSVSIVISSLINTYQYFVCGMFFLILIPLYIKICSKDEQEIIYIAFSKGIILTFAWIFLLSVLFVEVDYRIGYTGILRNPNALGYYIGIATIAVLYLYDKKTKNRVKQLFVLSCIFALMYLSRSRTTMLSVVFSLVIWILQHLFQKKKLKVIIVKLVVILASFFIAFGLVILITQFGGVANTKQSACNINDIALFNNVFEQKFNSEGKTLEQYSTGRTLIWREFIEELNIRGHSPAYQFVVGDRGVNSTAHNTILQLAYENGIICGILFVLYIVLITKKIIINYLKDDSDSKFVMMVTVSFFVYMMLSSIYNPFYYIQALAFVIIQIPLWKK